MIHQDVDERLAFDRHRLPGALRSIMTLVQPQNNARESAARRRKSGQFERLASIEPAARWRIKRSVTTAASGIPSWSSACDHP